jgi:cell division protein FtsL
MNPITALFQRRVRGVRLIDVALGGVFAVTALGVMVFKAEANRERTEIARLEREIATERETLRLLRAETAHLEQPARVERLSRDHLALAPVAAKHEADADSLIEIARGAAAPRSAAPVVAETAVEATVETAAAGAGR